MNDTRNKWQKEIVDGIKGLLDTLASGNPGAKVYLLPFEDGYQIFELEHHKPIDLFYGTWEQVIEHCKAMQWHAVTVIWCRLCQHPDTVNTLLHDVEEYANRRKCPRCSGDCSPRPIEPEQPE